jgi:hypothetical protein
MTTARVDLIIFLSLPLLAAAAAAPLGKRAGPSAGMNTPHRSLLLMDRPFC